uniref:ATP synthase F0 subunit 8 n=1 Tax=Chrysocoris stollii TaxID=1873032 RepID=A0A2P1CLR6_9HEMI|nr:ATP synthase F0 subunit 8 [Chrysocoris stollii]AVJ52269.1 ATP synthase F0 subunit 8 [Chrysocoris stollii]QNH68689.1 ATP synthase subunit 8 [Chrysocoris stollii]UCC45938.1 ATP synthase F0 subunit 8 [Chrysocoris stollii]
MPQMAPLFWETLFLMFIISMMMMMVVIFHMSWNKISKDLKYKKIVKQINWKW